MAEQFGTAGVYQCLAFALPPRCLAHLMLSLYCRHSQSILVQPLPISISTPDPSAKTD